MSNKFVQLSKAIEAQDALAVKRCLSLHPSLVHTQNSSGHTALHIAAAVNSSAQVLKELFSAGASCQAVDLYHDTPLHVAASAGHTVALKELLADAGRRSCLKAMNRDGATPLHLAAAAGYFDAAQLLVNAGAQLDVRNRVGRT
jgi:ankyrin repeat protein